MIQVMMEEFQIQHKKSTPYHPQVNGVVEEFNKILENTLTKVCNANCDVWDLKILVILWYYKMTCKRLKGQPPFKLVYGKEVMIPMKYIVLSLCIAIATGMIDEGHVEEILVQLSQLEDD